MKPKPLPSKQTLIEVLRYEPKTGEFFWRMRPLTMFVTGTTVERPRSAEHACNQWNSHFAGKPAATLKAGYWYICLFGKRYLAHRLAWKIMTGKDPVEIDHLDGNPSNNKWSNLESGTRSANQRNTALKSTNKTGYHGVSFSARQQKWIASIWVGSFDSKEEAIAARKHAEALLGYSLNHGRERRENEPIVELAFATKEEAVAAYQAAEKIRDQRDDFSEEEPTYQ